MPVKVDSRNLRRRLRLFRTELPNIAYQATADMAQDLVNLTIQKVRASWADHNQVGFDLENFLNIINKVEALPNNEIGVFNQNEMGTAADLDKIRGVPGLWHQGTRQGDRFGTFINQIGMFFDQVSELAQERSARWGGKEPQWFLIEYGTLGMGAYDPRPPNLAITNTMLTYAPRGYAVYADTATRMLKQRGIL